MVTNAFEGVKIIEDPKFIACIMAGNCDKYLELCIKAIEPHVDKVIVCYDTTSKDKTYDVLIGAKTVLKDKLEIIERAYEHDLNCKTSNGDQRNFYLSHLKEHYMSDWALCIDADEIISEGVKDFKQYIEKLEEANIQLISPKMEHFIGDFAHTDNTHKIHTAIHRLFKITPNLFYPATEHPVLQTTDDVMTGNMDVFTMYHLSSCREMFYFLERYKNHLAKSEMHTSEFLQQWYYSYLTGTYPTRPFDIHKLPTILKEHFMIDDDYFYFQGRGLETKHIMMAKQYQDYFKPRTILNCGDGIGIFTRAFEIVGNEMTMGFDISKFAVEHTIANPDKYWKDDVLEYNGMVRYDLVTVIDLLEHLEEKDLQTALKNIYHHGEQFLFSIPFDKEDDNLYKDPTHKIFKEKDWWMKQLTDVGFKIQPTPEYFYFKNQLVVTTR